MAMPNVSKVTDSQLKEIRESIEKAKGKALAWEIAEQVKLIHSVDLDESTIRGRFIVMGNPLRGGVGTPTPKQEEVKPTITTKTAFKTIADKVFAVPEELKKYIPQAADFSNYIERTVDKRLAMHYQLAKYPLTQGKQGTGKTFSHAYVAFKWQLPFFLYSCYEDFKLEKLFGDKTIMNGSVVFQESLFVKAIQSPSVILFDEVNAISNANTFPFHALLQNRQLFIKDANNGQGQLYRLNDDCHIGFAQNPKSVKYVGGNIKASNFLGRCTFLTYPEFTKVEIATALMKKFPSIHKEDLNKFVAFYFACIETIERSNIPVDISIRQLNNVVELWLHGMSLKDAIEDGMTSILEAVSQPKAKESFYRLAQAVWKELMEQGKAEKTGDNLSNFLIRMGRR
jgi:AAA domain (dynein-related subfamily)